MGNAFLSGGGGVFAILRLIMLIPCWLVVNLECRMTRLRLHLGHICALVAPHFPSFRSSQLPDASIMRFRRIILRKSDFLPAFQEREVLIEKQLQMVTTSKRRLASAAKARQARMSVSVRSGKSSVAQSDLKHPPTGRSDVRNLSYGEPPGRSFTTSFLISSPAAWIPLLISIQTIPEMSDGNSRRPLCSRRIRPDLLLSAA